ncbi:DMT family transporter [Acinetobacter qingfengensis]|uniref:Uncharacterized protein n=1 Tax=Acinetobacter qingfengensis TaxID=1262585 RepID=A0A1E7R346_9GAMM|nr:DMT family transporter [Acinetobacter qingfengensis]KAA8733764.1 DMT family transporter [Acinetobacter qingfengensis]OEY93724.1 hypothetical protein BJI46_04590 [Acinetobacter qingfengensis]
MRITDMILPIFLTGLIGFALATQTAINSQLRAQLNSPIQAAFFSFFIGTICLAVLMLLESATRPSLHQITQTPIWLWLGGFLGAYCISISIYTAPKLGFLSFTGLVLFGQVIMSALLDHFGLLGVERNTIHWQRIVGAILIAVGIVFTLHR